MNILGILFWDRIENWNLLSEDKDFKYAGVNPCFTGDMRLLTDKGYVRFDELVNQDNIKVVNVDGNITNSKVWCSGIKDTIALKLSDKRVITCTPEHRFMTIDGDECEAKDMKGKEVVLFNNVDNKVYVVDIEENGKEKVYDFTEPERHWGVVEGCIVHNCAELRLSCK